MEKVAVIILNRNLPKVTDKLYRSIRNDSDDSVDIFVVEGGSDKSKLSKYCTWHANWPEAKKNGLRCARGNNFALSNLYKENKFNDYDFYFLLTNDLELQSKNTVNKLIKIMKKHKKLALLSPCSKEWGEKELLKDEKTKYFWHINNNSFFIRKEFIKEIFNLKKPGYLNFLFDGNNFRGFGMVSEIIAKAYSRGWSAGITSEVWMYENESYLINQSDLLKTEPYLENLKLYIEEGQKWMKKKYGFSNKWAMNLYVKNYYNKFFKKNLALNKYKI
ncbi:hypothetical protein N8Z16_00745 [bacterium]|nr:hypothetical protein [bacterium]